MYLDVWCTSLNTVFASTCKPLSIVCGGGGNSLAAGNSCLRDASLAPEAILLEHKRRQPLDTCPALANVAALRKGGSCFLALPCGRCCCCRCCC